MLTIQILIKNNEDTIEKCLNSISTLGAKVIIVDIGSGDKTHVICDKFGFETIKHQLNNDYSKMRNRFLDDDSWNMYIEPYEFLAGGHDEIKNIVKIKAKQSFYFKVVQGTIISKEIRLWNKPLKFINPVYETINDDGLETKTGLIFSNQFKIDTKEYFKIIDYWKSISPTSIKPYYYQALTLLLQGRYAEFSGLADHYLFQDKNSKSAVMLRYHLAMVQAYQLDEINDSIRNIMVCISMKPLMAEFWCLLGDIYYKIKQYNKAKEFYENAMILGEHRLQSDMWPLDISKYKEYPIKMMENIKTTSEVKLYRQIGD